MTPPRGVRLEPWLLGLTERFVQTPSHEVETAIMQGLREIVEFLDVDRSTLFVFDTSGQKLTATHSWARRGFEAFVESTIDEIFPWYEQALAKGEKLVLRSLPDDLPEEAVKERDYCLKVGLQSNVTLPIRVGTIPVCALAAGSFRRPVNWSSDTIEQLYLAGEILASGLFRMMQNRELDKTRDLAWDFFDSLDSAATVLDRHGTVIGVNRGWRDGGRSGSGLFEQPVPSDPIGKNYIDLLDASAREGNDRAAETLRGIRAVLGGDLPLFLMEYPSRNESGERWNLIRALSRRRAEGGAILMEIDITDRIEKTRQLEQSLERIEQLRRALEEEKLYLREEIMADHDFENIVGKSTEIRGTLARIERVSPTGATVLLLGETGTGKELLAHAIHERSARNAKVLIKVNCAALPATLIESELFGHVRGAFTGAVANKKGRFELADGGTLFLDEIGDLDLALQAKLLRVLESGEFERVGSTSSMRVDIRLIAATNRNLGIMVRLGEFREDLFHRLNTFPIEVPPLRRRVEDIPLLVWHFLDRCEREWGRRITHVPAPVMEALQRYSWPGNVRELQNVVERAVILSSDKELLLDPGSLGPSLGQANRDADDSLDTAQRDHISRVLESCDWRINGPGNAAERLGIHPNTLRHRLKKLGIERPR